MKKNILLYLITFICFSCSEKEVEFNSLVERNGLFYEVNNDNPFSGKVFQKYANDQFLMTGFFEKGLKTGEWINYYNNGQIKLRENYSQNFLDGIFESFNENGSPIILTNYKKGKFNGNYKEYSGQDRLLKNINYKEGNYEGNYLEYNDKGNLIIQTNYKNGIIHGSFIEFYENGNEKVNYSMNNGIFDGDYTEYNENGVIKTQFNYANGSKRNKGNWTKYWDKDWKIKPIPSKYYSTVSFDDNGKLSSKVKFFYQNNNEIASEHAYLSLEPDIREGKSIWYSEDGEITIQGHYKNNKREGLWETFYKSNNYVGNKLKERANYMDGQLKGEYVRFEGGQEFTNPANIINIRFQTIDGYWKVNANIQSEISDVSFNVWLIERDDFYGKGLKCRYKSDYYVKHINKQYSLVNSYLEQNNRKYYDINGNLYRGKLKDKRKPQYKLFCK